MDSRDVAVPKTLMLLDYRNRGAQASGNLGDHVQTIAMMRVIVKWLNIWSRVRRSMAVPSIGTCPRDEEKEVHSDAALFLYGWHQHRSATGAFAFPPRTRRAIATSFHVSSENMLTPSALEFLSSIGPVGCRDFSTLRKLRAHGVPSFYSGCVTLTLPEAPRDRARSGVLAVDTVRPERDVVTLAMWSPENRLLTQQQMWMRALCVLRLLRRTQRVYSSRLHVLYPCKAMGTHAIIQSPSGDSRTDWGAPGRWETARLYATGARDHKADARRLERAIGTCLGHVFLGGEANVAAAWRKSVLLHVVFCFDASFAIPTLACANSLLRHNGEKPLFLHFFYLGISAGDLAEMRARLLHVHPGTMMEFHSCDGSDVHKGYDTHLPHVSAQTMQRLWLHERLPSVDRVLYIDGDMIVRGPLDYLFDLRVPVIAARNSIENIMLSTSWNRGMAYSGSTCFNAGLMIMNLKALRRLRFTKFVNGVLAVQSCNDQTVLNLFCQGSHTALPSTYNFFAREPKDIASGVDPTIVHFCGSKKPWNSTGIHLGAEWHTYRL